MDTEEVKMSIPPYVSLSRLTDPVSATVASRGRVANGGRFTQVAIIALAVVALPGCRGCFRPDEDPTAKAAEEKKEKPKPDFDVGRLQVLLRDDDSARNLVKVGHWMMATQRMRANNFDFHAELESAATDRDRTVVSVPDTAFRMTAARPVVLPKGQTRELETMFFIPDVPPSDDLATRATVWLRNTLRARRGGREIHGADEPTTTMPAYQYFFVVLAEDPDRYGYLKRLDAIVPPVVGEGELSEATMHYRVILPQADRRVPVPSQGLTWTPIAYVLWDGLSPNLLSPDQQQAMLDWLHWGGQVLISGPGSLDRLRDSFLEPYLPARAVEAVPLAADDFESLNQGWSLISRRTKAPTALVLPAGKPLVGVRLEPHPEAEAIPSTNGLVWERQIGAGRVVVTAFSLSDRPVLNWGSFDSFFNACLLRRPARVFRATLDGEPDVQWADWLGLDLMRDARFVTGLRYFSRDAATGSEAPDPVPAGAAAGQVHVAAWNDTSEVSDAARQTLREAAGIAIPEARFVFRVLAAYLLVLVPLNWLVFRLFGRLEWAWLAAPAIAVVAALVVVRLAQLDIGFARSRTEIAVLEVQGGYSWAHLTRYTALYTSLSTAYDFRFEHGGAVAMPFPHRVPYAPGPRETVADVTLRRDQQLRLSGFQVASNSTGLVHSEQMQDLGGVVRLTGQDASGWRVENGTPLLLEDAGVLYRTREGRLELAIVGSLGPAGTAQLDFRSAESVDEYLNQVSDEGGQALRRLLKLAAKDAALRPGDVRFVAWTRDPLPGLEIRPQASQESMHTLVLVHLRRGPRSPPQPDRNLKADVLDELPNAAEATMSGLDSSP